MHKLVSIANNTLSTEAKRKIRALLPLVVKRHLGKVVMQSAARSEDNFITIADGRKFQIIEDRLFLRVLLDKSYEPDLTSVVEMLVVGGDVVVDVGANFGWYTTLLHKLTGSTGMVYSYEPSEYSFDVLKKNLILNDVGSSVIVRPVCVGEEKGSALLKSNGSSESGLAHVVEEEDEDTTETDVVSLDDELKDYIGKVAFMKIDIEGYELSAIKGALKILSCDNKPILQLELNNDALIRAGSSKQELLGLLDSFGYEIFECNPMNSSSLKKATINSSDVFCAANGIYGERVHSMVN